MTENASRRVEEAELVVDKMFFIGSDSHEYRCPRGISQKLAADQCCSCPVVGLESCGYVEVAAFWSKSVDVMCQGTVVHSFWYPEDTILKIKVLPMDTREPELYAEHTLAAGVVLIVATLNRGLVVYCVGMQCASSEGRFRSAYITELPADLSTTFENFRIRDITATMVGDDGLIVTTSSVPRDSFSGSSHRVLMSYYSLPDVIATVCDHIGNETWSAKESRTAVIMEDMSTIKDLVVRREEQGKYTVAILTSIELCCLYVTIDPYFAVGTPVAVSVPKFHPTQRLGTAVSLIQCQLMGQEIKFCALCKPRRAITSVMNAVIDNVLLQQEVDNTLEELQMPLWMSGLESPSMNSAEDEYHGQHEVIDLKGRIGLDNGSTLSPLNGLMSVREKTAMEIVESPEDQDQLAHLVFFRIRVVRGVPTLASFTTPLPSVISDFDSVFVEEVALCADQDTIVSSGDNGVKCSSTALLSTSGGHTRFRFCYLTVNSNRLHVANVLVQHNLLSTQMDSFEMIDTFNNLLDKPSGGKVRGFGMISRSNDQLRAIVSRKPTAKSRPSLRIPINVSIHEPCKLVMAYFTRAPKSCKDGDYSLALQEGSHSSESFMSSSGVLNNIDDDGSDVKDHTIEIGTPDCTEYTEEVCPLSDVKFSGYSRSTDRQEESKGIETAIMEVVAAQPSVARDRISSSRLSIEEKMDLMIQSMAKFQVSVLERMDNLESAMRVNSERIKVLEDNIISYQTGKLKESGDSWFESVFQG